MSGYDYDVPRRTTRREYREERYDEREPRFLDAAATRGHSGRELVPRGREDSDLSVEEIRRDFPMPGHGQTIYSREVRRARSADPGWDDYDDRRSYYSRDPRDRDYDRYDRDYDRDYDRRSRKEGSIYYEEEKEKRRLRTISKQEKIIAAIAGAALAVGGKELYDRHEGKEHGGEVNRNPAVSAAIGAAGALAAYQGAGLYNKHAEKEERKSTTIVHKGRDGHMIKYYEEEDEDPKKKQGHKNFLESALAAAGLGGAVKALTGGKGDDDKDRDRDRDGRSDVRSRAGSRRGSRSRSRSKSPDKKNKIQQAAMASLIAGATEAFRVAKEPGGWKGEKAKRVFTAAAGAATIDAAQNPDKNQKLSLAESVIGGLVGNRVIHGSKKNIEEDKATGRSRSRSRAARDSSKDGGGGGGVSGLAALATAGLGAFGAKKILDSRKDNDSDSRSRSRGARSRSRRPRSRSSSRGGSRSPSRKGVRARSRSVVDGARRRLARIGIGNGPEEESRSDVGSPRGSSRGGRRRRYSDEYDDRDRRRQSRSRSRGAGGRRYDGASDTDLGDSDDDKKETKRKRGKQLLTIGLAGVATIHAAHNVYQSMEKRNARHAAVKDGRLSPEEAKKLKTKALLQDAASVGIAALGIKSAISEVKEAQEVSKELEEWKHEKRLRHQRRIMRLARQRAILDREYESDLERERSLVKSSRTRSRSRSSSRADTWAVSSVPRSSHGGRYEDEHGPLYRDGNPYPGSSGAIPAPHAYYDYDDRRR